MNDRVFEASLTTFFWLVVACIIAGIAMAGAGMRWANLDLPLLIFLTILTGLGVLILGGAALLYFWGQRYMSRG
jgi:drug/metabolite transporter (DMT)-like permease